MAKTTRWKSGRNSLYFWPVGRASTTIMDYILVVNILDLWQPQTHCWSRWIVDFGTPKQKTASFWGLYNIICDRFILRPREYHVYLLFLRPVFFFICKPCLRCCRVVRLNRKDATKRPRVVFRLYIFYASTFYCMYKKKEKNIRT